MTDNTELIAAARAVLASGLENRPWRGYVHDLVRALEVAEHRIADLEAQNRTLIELREQQEKRADEFVARFENQMDAAMELLRERDALAATLDAVRKIRARRSTWHGFSADEGRELDAVLGSSSVSPQHERDAEEWAREVSLERARQFEKGYTTEHDYSHGWQHLIRWASDYARRGKTVEVGAMLEALGLVLSLRDDAIRESAQSMLEVIRPYRTEQGGHPRHSSDTPCLAEDRPVSEPSEESIAAAARVFYAASTGDYLLGTSCYRNDWLRMARAALKAAAEVSNG
ncbi:hypothetical protein [Humibacter ginsenosidimutans]|uniref:Uncharacterized protein n=1 Tax=Humibacter ginsenosidimutans TaxID=2599293 RepID=A0A5B8M677_9MICO|nr:hypothetical protein [Humibacter ginsenosidimutans]QDZ15796.1 hypothetical protein FPZ11_14405 [Humibacter ginsenosidimutans]